MTGNEAFEKHVREEWGQTTFASMHTSSSAAEYKRAFLAGFAAASIESEPESVLLNAIALCLSRCATGVHGVFIDVRKFRESVRMLKGF